jgi:heterodisulfide reductase subunit A2
MMYEKKGRYIVEFPDIPSKREHQIEIDVEERRNSYKEVELGFDEEKALREAKRCLSCRRCLGCALCWAECSPEAINFEMQDELLELDSEMVVISPGVERAIPRIDKKFGLGKYPNVITDLQFERMLAQSGPTAGVVLRPYDGEIPKSIAFLQSYSAAPSNMHSAALCFGVNEAILTRRKLANATVQLFVTGVDPFLEEHGDAVRGLNGIEILEAGVTGVAALEDHTLRVTFDISGQKEERMFDLVVLLTQPVVSKETKDLSKTLGLDLSYATFINRGAQGYITTQKETLQLVAHA